MLITCGLIVCLLSQSTAQETEQENYKLRLGVGTVANAERLSSAASTKWGISAQFDFQREISRLVYGGLKLHYFNLDMDNYLLISPCIYTGLIDREHINLILVSNIGYSFSDDRVETGVNWGGVNLGLNLENNYKLVEKTRLELGYSFGYFLQERKYRTFLGTLDSDMMHAFVFNLNIAIRL